MEKKSLTLFLQGKPKQDREIVKTMVSYFGGFNFDANIENLKADYQPTIKARPLQGKALKSRNVPFFASAMQEDIEDNIEEKEKPLHKAMGKTLDYSFMQA